MRWSIYMLGLGLIGLSLAAGCQQSCYVAEPDLVAASKTLGIPPDAENDPTAGIVPFLGEVSEPATILNPDRTPRYFTLQEALAIALESGTVGLQSIRSPGIPTDDLVTFTGNGVVGSDAVRVFALQPAAQGAAIEANLARFDAQWLNSMTWNTVDNPTQGLSAFTNGSTAALSTALAKPLPTGGVAGITFSTNYQNLSTPPSFLFRVLNPAYTTNLQFGFEQPLLRYYGVAINQLLAAFPASSLYPGINSRPAAVAPEGLLITRLRFDQSRAEFERRVNFLLLNVEVAYWNLYGSYVSLFAAEQGLRMARESWRIGKANFESGKFNPIQFAQVRAQYEQFRVDRLLAVSKVLDNERALRILLGMKMEDGTRLIPADAPTLAPYLPNWEAAYHDALSLRPELILARQDLKAKQFALTAAKTLLKPDLRLQATYSLVGLGSRLDGNGTFEGANGPQTTNSLRSLTSGDFVNWTVGLTMNMPIGFRNELAQVRQARLALAQAYAILKDQEKKAHNVLTKQYRQVIETYKTIEIRRLRRLTLATELKNLNENVEAGSLDPTSRTYGDSLLDAQRLWAQALSDEYQAIVDYNNALALFEFAKGTIQHHDRISIAEGPLPPNAQIRAVEHERQRTNALVVRERSMRSFQPGRQSVVTVWPEDSAPRLPSLWDQPPELNKQAPPASELDQAVSDAAPQRSGPWQQDNPPGPTLPAMTVQPVSTTQFENQARSLK
jgi:outer membrane protein TolC